MKLSVVMACYNEVDTIAEIIDAVRRCPYQNREIIVVDDCSTDGTRQKLQSEIEARVDRVVYHERNQGKGAAIWSGVQASTGDIVIFQDADLELDPGEIPKVIRPILDGKADVVYGSRFLGSDCRLVVNYRHMLGNKVLTTISNIFSGLYLTDMETCYKAFRGEVIRAIEIEEKRFGIEPELTAKVAQMKCRLFEVAVTYNSRSYDEGKKIGWKDAVSAIRCIIKYNLFRKQKPLARSAQDDTARRALRMPEAADQRPRRKAA